MERKSGKGMRKRAWAAVLMTEICLMLFTCPVLAGQWRQEKDGYWYDYQNGSYAVGWSRLGGIWYYFNENGYMKTGWQNINHQWYYLGESGAMRTDWQCIDNQWYYFGGSGVMKTGWQFIQNKWYYLGGNGVMRHDWQYIDGSWYYFDTSGAMHTSWLTIGEQRYYLDESGKLQIGAFSDGSFQYMTDTSGAVYRNMTKGKQKFDENGCIMMKNRDGNWEYVPDVEELIARKKETFADDLWERRYASEGEFRSDVKETLSGFLSEREIQYVIEEAIAQFEKDFEMSYNAYIRRYGKRS